MKTFDWIPDFVEVFIREEHQRYLVANIETLTTSAPTKYEGYRMLFIFACVHGLGRLNTRLSDDLQEAVTRTINRSLTPHQLFSPSPYSNMIVGKETIDWISSYMALSIIAVIDNKRLSDYKEVVEENLRRLDDRSIVRMTLREIYSMTWIVNHLSLSLKEDLIRVTKERIYDHVTFDGAFSLEPLCESHAGAVFCALNALQQLDCLNQMCPVLTKRVLRWLVFRQYEFGFQVS